MEGDRSRQSRKIFSMDLDVILMIAQCGSSIFHSYHISIFRSLRIQSSVIRSVFFFDGFSSAKLYCLNQGEQKESKSAGGRWYWGLGLRKIIRVESAECQAPKENAGLIKLCYCWWFQDWLVRVFLGSF